MTQGVKKEQSQILVEDITASIDHFDYEMRVAHDNYLDMVAREKILNVTLTKVESEMAKDLIKNMLDDLHDEIVTEKDRERISRDNKNYYQEILEALDETIKSM